jgi:hypothetical protein
MTPNRWLKRLIKATALLCACLVFWFVTANAVFSVQRMVTGFPMSSWIISALDVYESPLIYLNKNPVLRRMSGFLDDKWRQILDPPDTTP